MTTPRIVFVTRALDVGGAERQLAELAIGLHRAGWHVKVVSFYRGGVFEERLRGAGVALECLDKRGRWDLWYFPWRLVTAVRKARPDIVHGNLGLPNVLMALLRPAWLQARVVWWVGAAHAELRQDDWLVIVESRLGVLLSRFADLIICNSEAGRRHHVARGYPEDRTVVVPNGIDTAHFKPDAAARRAVRAEWGVADGETLIGLVARLDPIKDHPNFLSAISKVLAARSDLRFVCVGDGPSEYHRQLVDLAARLGVKRHVVWAGERLDMARVYNALDLAVSASASEGLPNAVGEAMATGVPCVATDVGDTAALIGETGWLCPPQDSGALAQAILRALDEQSLDHGPPRERICTNYTIAAMLDRSISHLARLISQTPPRRAA